ncbi:MAG: hypothetical protein PHW02_06415 [bacterium]|nr:hypothetical protein [bacterium]
MKKKKKRVGEIVRKKDGTLDVRTPLMPTKRINDKRKKKPKHKTDLSDE